MIYRAGRARYLAHEETVERISMNYPFSRSQVRDIMDGLTEAEARQLCTLAIKMYTTPGAARSWLESMTGDIHAALAGADGREDQHGPDWCLTVLA